MKKQKISIDASFIFDEIINKYVDKWKDKRINIHLRGKVSSNRDVNNFLLSFGLFKQLGFVTRQICPQSADSDHDKHFIIFRKRGRATEPHLAGNACTELADFFEQCFNHNEFSIKREARNHLTEALGEIIRNAEEHSGNTTKDWNIIACYSRKNHRCSFSIINYGRSFYDSLSTRESTVSSALAEVEAIIVNHLSALKKMRLDTERYEENIWTMMAIQDGISSKRTLSGTANTRGQGIMDVVSFVDTIRNKNHKKSAISIISGYTDVLINFEYPIKKIKIGASQEKRRFMILNNKQRLQLPPDANYVNNIPSKFEGTIFSGSFIIDPVYLRSKLENNSNE